MASLIAVVITTAIAAGLWWINSRIDYPSQDSGSVVWPPGVSIAVIGIAWTICRLYLPIYKPLVVLSVVQVLVAIEPLRRKAEGDS